MKIPLISSATAHEPLSSDYSLEVDGRQIAVHEARVSAIPFNQVWPGYQRPLDQTEIAAFASWDMTGPVEVKIVSGCPIERIVVRPHSAGIQPDIEGEVIRFKLDRPRQFTVEINGHHRALHCFANPPVSNVPSPDDKDVIFFGPGVHRPGVIMPKSGQSIYLAEGAIVHGVIHATEAHNLHITGRGILDASTFERFEVGGGSIRLRGCHDCVIEGITLRDPDVWTVIVLNSRNIEISNIKLIGLWRYNADGIDLVNSQQIHIRDCFVRAYDDCIVLKGLVAWVDYPTGVLPVEDILVERCVLWNDWGRALEIGAETVAPVMRRITFRDCDIIHSTHIAMDIQNGDRALVEQVVFENISVELNDGLAPPQYQDTADTVFSGEENSGHLSQLMVLQVAANSYSKDNERGRIADIRFKNINVLTPSTPPSCFQGFDSEHDVSGITIEGLMFNGKPVETLAEAGIHIDPHVRDVTIRAN